MHFVLDPSVVIKWYVSENLTDAALHLREQIEEKSQLVAVPRFFFLESASILWKKASLIKELSASDAKGIFSRILDLPFQVIEDDDLLLKALALALEYSISIYDAMYLACVIYSKAVLVTADSAFERRFSHSSLRKQIRHLAEFNP